MSMKHLPVLVWLAALFAIAPAVYASDEAPGLYVIYDSSNSMWGELADGTRKYEAAREAIGSFLESDFGDQELALRVYGAARAGDCTDSALAVPFQPSASAASLIGDAVSTSRPTGRTPIHLSLIQALEDFGDRPGRILLISDGIESCGADPCELLREWRDRNVNIDVHIVGFGLREQERPALVCMADAAGTPFVEADSAGELAMALRDAEHAEVAGTADEPVASEPSSAGSAAPPALILRLRNADGESVRGQGVAFLIDNAGEQIEFSETQDIETHSRNAIIPGRNLVHVGIVTRNGDIPHPVERAVDVAATGETIVEFEVVEPPQVRVILRQNGIDQHPIGTVDALIDGDPAFSFRTQDTVYVNAGTYVFRTSPNDFNQNAEVEMVVPASGVTDVIFDLTDTVRTTLRFFAAPWGERVTGAIRFYRDGEDIAGANSTNAVTLAPGSYAYAMDYRFGAIEGDVEITSDVADTIDIQVPMTRVVLRYQDVSGVAESDKRSFITAESSGRRRTQQSGTTLYLAPGAYVVEGWGGTYEPLQIEVSAGEDLDLVLRATE